MIREAFFIFILKVVLSAPTENLSNLGIVGGQKADQELFNYQISLMVWGRHHCGGTLVTTNLVITAAHCTKGISRRAFQVRVGSKHRLSGGVVHDIKEYVVHPEFTMEHLRSDVSIIRLATHVKLNKNVATLSLTNEEPAANTEAVISGWGYTKEGGPLSDDLLFARVPIIDRSFCQNRLQLFSKEMICAGKTEGGIDACQADSGGPLVCKNKLCGIVSWGIGCGRPGQPGVYTNVAYTRSWIEQTMRDLSAKN